MNLSLRVRLLWLTAVGVAVALLLSGWVLHGLFAQHIQQQFERNLLLQLDQLTARLDFGADRQPLVNTDALSDPRWQRPYGGLYWQIDAIHTAQTPPQRVTTLRSRSLWDTTLALANDPMADGGWHVHTGLGPQQQPLLMVERALQAPETPGVQWRLVVAEDTQAQAEALHAYRRVLFGSLATLFALLVLAAWAQVALGLRPLASLQTGLNRLRAGHTPRLEGDFPPEVQPLVADLNQVLAHNEALLDRARTQAGNLAHALKTPLAVLRQVAAAPQHTDHPWRTVQEQVDMAQRHIDWHLKRAHLAAGPGRPGQQAPVQPCVDGLLRVMAKVHADRGITLQNHWTAPTTRFAGEAHDLQEMVGNLLDNACKWARQTVVVGPGPDPGPGRFAVRVSDDGPGVGANAIARITQRGVRLDEEAPGSGLGLAIVQDLARLWGGGLELASPGELGGLTATLVLPLAPEAVPTGQGHPHAIV